MSSEIVVADPAVDANESGSDGYDENRGRRPMSVGAPGGQKSDNNSNYGPEPFDSERLPVTLALDIRRFLRVANMIDAEEPRIAYLCRFHAFEIAHNRDHNSIGRGVRQFKTSLLQRLEQDEAATIMKRKEKSDIRELRRVCRKYKDYIFRHGRSGEIDNGELMYAREIASVLFDVLNTVTNVAGPQDLADRDSIHTKSKFYVPYNILPLDPGSAQQPIMRLPEVKAAVAAIRNTRGLPVAEDFHKRKGFDLFDWLHYTFGFQEGNVANQREHLILLLANIHIRQSHTQASILELGHKTVHDLMKKFFKNYTNWCKFLGRKSNIRLPSVKQEAQQYKLLYMGLYLLIWGEAANLRFMPECLCYIFHQMAYELHGVLTSAVSITTGERVTPAYGGDFESFLINVVSPIYKVICEEAKKGKSGAADHSSWRNYDDLNEYFWSPDCFEIGWPMRLGHNFFCVDNNAKAKKGDKKKKKKNEENGDEEQGEIREEVQEPQWLGKTKFVEIRSFWQIFWSFDRMWSFLILSLQAMIIIACHDLDSPLQIFDSIIFGDIMSIFITSAVLKLIQAVLEIAFTWKARQTMDLLEKRKILARLVMAMIWIIVLPICYADSRGKYRCSSSRNASWLDVWCFNSYMVAVVLYLMTNAVDIVLFLVPAVRNYIEISNHRICTVFFWWTQPRLYVGRGMQESQLSVLKYSLFWILVLSTKFIFSYYFEIKPLINPTRQIMKIGVETYDWHELFPKVNSNAGAVLAIWAPIIIVYFMDTQIWYSVFCTIYGGCYGVLHHLGEIRTLGMLRSRFHSLPSAFNACLVPLSSKKDHARSSRNFLFRRFRKVSEKEKSGVAKFSVTWNHIIESLRSEDLISNREMDLMTIPMSYELVPGMVCWPVFLLANKFSTALTLAKEFVGKDKALFRRIRRDNDTYCAVMEGYQSLRHVLDILVVGDLEKKIISAIFDEVETSIGQKSLLEDFKMSELPALQAKCAELLEYLVEGNEEHHGKIVKLLQDMFELVTEDMMTNSSKILDLIPSSNKIPENSTGLSRQIVPQLFESTNGKDSINFPLQEIGNINEQIRRFLLLLTVKDTALDIPTNLEAQRRILFFATSLFMDMPIPPRVRNMISFSVITPHFREDINFSTDELHLSNDQVSIIFYLQKIFPDEWKNFLERVGCDNMDSLEVEGKDEEFRRWASFRGQTLSRTVRGMMYYRKALKLQAFLDMAEEEETREANLDALADLKFTHIVSCQIYGLQRSSEDPHAKDVLDMMTRYPSLRVAYVEEKEDIMEKKLVYSSILLKGVKSLKGESLDQEVYRVKLPGPPNLGEGKPENQNHAIIFTRGEALQAIDMNQDNYLEEAIKMRNVLQEFQQHQGQRPPTLLGLREHIFTGSVSSLAWFMSYQESSFVTIGQRVLANPLRVRFHYGHPDIFDRIFHITRGGISKASKTINLSEDVFAGFNSTLRRGHVTYHEYLQVGKGRDVGLNAISKFEAKVANGNSEQTISRDIHRLARRFDFFRMLSCYYTTVGFYFSSLISVIGIYVFLYGQLYLVLSGLQKALLSEARLQNIKSLQTALASQSFIQLGLLTGLPMVMEIGLEKGFLTALKDFVLMQLQLAAVFFTFSFGTKSHYYGRTILHGGAKYRPTGRKVVVFHATFTENYRLYSRSHFVKGFELVLLLIVYDWFRRSYQSNVVYVFITYSIWFMSITWLFAPFLFNPSGFNWGKIVDDWKDWNKWIDQQGGIGVQQDKSWESWWNDEQAHLRSSGLRARLIEIFLSLRFFMYQYGLVYHLDISQQNKNVLVYVLSWVVILAIILLVKAVDLGRQLFSAKYHFWFRLFKVFLFLGVLSIIISLYVICDLSSRDLIVCSLAFIPTGWGLILVAQAVRPKIEKTGLWYFARVLVKAYDYGMGTVLFAPIAVLAWLPIISAFQTRFLFNEAFNRHLQIQPILAGKKKQS